MFAFGDAAFFGSMGGQRLNAPVVGTAAQTDLGYYLVGEDGGVFTFGDAVFTGSAVGVVTSPVIVVFPSPPGRTGRTAMEVAEANGTLVSPNGLFGET